MVQLSSLVLAAVLVFRIDSIRSLETAPHETTTSLATDDSELGTSLIFTPPDLSPLNVSTTIFVHLNLSKELLNYARYFLDRGHRFYIGLTFNKLDPKLANMMSLLPSQSIKYELSKTYNLSYNLFWELKSNGDYIGAPASVRPNDTQVANGFILSITNIGYPYIHIDILERQTDNISVIYQDKYQVKAIRSYRTADLGFTIAITVISMLNSFAIGCLAEVAVLRAQLKKSYVPIGVAAGTQYLAIPALTFGLVNVGNISPEIAVGMLLCSCVPGGGLGHLIVLVTGNANTELSVAINFMQIFVPLGAVPLWIYSLGHMLENGIGVVAIPTHYMVMCLAILIIPYLLGVTTRHFKSSVSEAILNWLIKPLLLLFMILFITLGVYINIYAMSVLDKTTLAMAGLMPSLGFCIGGGFTLIVRQGKASAKSVAIEAAIMNCLAVIAAAKLTMGQPDSDMACAGAIAILFFTPVPFIGMLIFHKVKKKIMYYFENRRFEKEHHETILKSFGAITQNALQMSGMTPEQINARKKLERINNLDKTLISDEECLEEGGSQTVVQIRAGGGTSGVETVAVSRSNNTDYL